MPIYDFTCEDCGPFEQRRSFDESATPTACPTCGGDARRLYSMPNTRTMTAALSNAMNRSEKSAYDPEVARRPKGATLPGKRFSPGSRGHHGHNH